MEETLKNISYYLNDIYIYVYYIIYKDRLYRKKVVKKICKLLNYYYLLFKKFKFKFIKHKKLKKLF